MRKQSTASILARADAEYGRYAVPPRIWRDCVSIVIEASGSQDAAQLDHCSVPDAILLCEALNWAAKVWWDGAYDYKEGIVQYTVGLMDETGSGSAWNRADQEFTMDGEPYDTQWVVVLEHPAVGSVGFHGVAAEWADVLPITDIPWSGLRRQPEAFDHVAAWVRGDMGYFEHLLRAEAESLAGRLRLAEAFAARDAAADAAYKMAAESGARTPAERQAVVQRAWRRIMELRDEFPFLVKEIGEYAWFDCQLDEEAVELAVAAAARGEEIPRRSFSAWVSGRYAEWRTESSARTAANGFEEESATPRRQLTADEARRARFHLPEWGMTEDDVAIPVGSLRRFAWIEPADPPKPPTPEPPPRTRRFRNLEFAD
jgi:hypothetical protein